MSFPSKAYTAFEKDALKQLKTQSFEKFETQVRVDYIFYMKGKMSTDVDNMIAGINDILELAGVLENDKLIKIGTFEVVAGNKEWRSEISITPYEI